MMNTQAALNSAMMRILAACALALIAAMSLRWLFIDSDSTRRLCEADGAQVLCQLRGVLSLGLRHGAISVGLLIATIAALVWPSLTRLGTALVLCSAGLVLYHADIASGAAAVILLSLALRPRE